LEIALALAASALLLPVALLAALLVATTSRGPLLYRQERVGRGGVSFQLNKFRSMTAARARSGADPLEITAAGDARITPVGRLLRATKVDELPQLWNVLRGEMSWVGPRPEVPRYVDLGQELWREVLSVRPGLTDPATLALRHEEALLATAASDPNCNLSEFYASRLLPLKLQLSRRYLHQRSARTDLAILYRTLVSVVWPQPPATLVDLERALQQSEESPPVPNT
jgi:lipopolysaccharide/colanic/teichoic acid biosynthesis glycosyltransferase